MQALSLVGDPGRLTEGRMRVRHDGGKLIQKAAFVHCLPLDSWSSASLGTPLGTLKSVPKLNLSSVRWGARYFSIDSYAPLMEDGSWKL